MEGFSFPFGNKAAADRAARESARRQASFVPQGLGGGNVGMPEMGGLAPSGAGSAEGRVPEMGGSDDFAFSDAQRIFQNMQTQTPGSRQRNRISAIANFHGLPHRPTAPADRQAEMGASGRIPGPRAPDPPVNGRTAPLPKPAVAEMAASAPSPQPTRVFRTDKSTFEVVKSIASHGGQTVEKGMSAGVNLVRRKESGRLRIEKLVPVSTAYEHARARAEVDILMQIRAAGAPCNLNLVLEAFHAPGAKFVNLILEYCDGGTVHDLIKRHAVAYGQFGEPLVWHMLAGLAKGLHFCHTGIDVDNLRPAPQDWNTICHLDIKPSNVFLSMQNGKNGVPRVVLGDFGSATTWKDIQVGVAERTVQVRGTPGWFPPEVKASSFGGWDGRYGIPTDVWQMGGVMQALCRLVVLPDMSSAEEMRACGRMYSERLNAVVSGCMHRDPTKRPTAQVVAKEAKKQLESRGMTF